MIEEVWHSVVTNHPQGATYLGWNWRSFNAYILSDKAAWATNTGKGTAPIEADDIKQLIYEEATDS